MPEEPLYANDSYIKEFDSKVVRSGPRYAILDRTAFYPEGGGQPSDTGVLRSSDDEWRVVKVVKRGRDIYHYLDGDIAKGTEVHCIIDWDRRFWNMRRHSAEHLLTGLFKEEGEGPKTYSDLDRLEYRPSEMDDETVKRVEAVFNQIVEDDIPVRIYYTDRSELDFEEDERKAGFLEKIPPRVQKLRMIQIGKYALTFCMGTHVNSTGEIGKLERLELESKRKGLKIVHFELAR